MFYCLWEVKVIPGYRDCRVDYIEQQTDGTIVCKGNIHSKVETDVGIMSMEMVGSEQSREKMKKDKKKRKAETDEPNTPSTSHKISINPMESKKQKRALDKERRRVESEKKVESKQKLMASSESRSNQRMEISPATSVLPEFHIGVFKDLAAAEASIREAAAHSLVAELLEVQKGYDSLENKEVVEGQFKLEAEKDDGLNNCAPSLRYAVRRLIRGVSSSRECARQGFALGMTVLVGAVPCIKVDALLKLIVELLEFSSSMKGQDIKDCLLGRLFAYGAIARSGRLTLEWTADKNTPYIKEFVGSLVSLAAKKTYLQEPAVSIILELVDKLPVEVSLNHVLEAPGLKEWFEGATEVGNPDALLLALTIREKTGVDNKVFGKLLPFPYSPSRLFTVENLSLLSNCLKESHFCQPRTHSIWYSLVNILLPENVLQDIDPSVALSSVKKHKKARKGNSAEEDIEKNLKNFCEVIIEGSLLPSSHNCKNLAFNVLLLLLPKLPASCIYNVLSYKVVQCLKDVLSAKDTNLFKAGQHFLREFSEWVKHDDVRRVAVIMALQKHSNGKFDCVTRSKTVKELMSEFKTESGCMLLIQNLVDMFLDETHASEEPSDQSQTTDDNSEIGSLEDKDSIGALGTPDFLKAWVIESLPNCLKHLTLDTNARFRVQREILKFLAVQGLFSSTLGTEVTSFELEEKFRWPKSAISSALCRTCIEQLQLLLSNAQKGEGPQVVASGLEANDLGAYFMRFLTTLRNIPSVSLFRSLSDDDEEAIKKLQSMESQLSRQERNLGPSIENNKFHSMRYLLIQLLLQVLLRPQEFSEAASELVICCTKAFQSSDLASTEEDETDGDDAPECMDVLVDTMLSLLPQSSAPMRTAIEQVFKCFCHDVTDDGLLRMLRVIKKDLKPARHQETDSENEDDDGEDDDILDIEEAEESDEAEMDGTAESDGHADDSETVVGVEGVSSELPEASDDDSDWDDDAMLRMDTSIAKYLKDRKNQAGSETAHSQLALFKLRVLSLLEIYLHENPGKPQVLKIFSSLAQAFVNPHTTEGNEQLGQRIWGILQKKIFKAKDYPRGEAIQFPVLKSLLERNLALSAKPFKKKKSASGLSKKKLSAALNRYKMINSLAQSSTFWILKIIDAKNLPESELQEVFLIFREKLEGYLDSKSTRMKCEFLKEVFKRRPWIGHHLFGFLLEKCASAKLQFRQIEALELVIEVLKSIVSSKPDDSSYLAKLGCLVNALLKNMPDKASRRADVRKFCGKVIQVLTDPNPRALFLRALEPDCEAQLTDMFPVLKK
ncbi:rDNA transcriptional regulator pol5 isoform X1 [Lycium ferocissimum]|uniref:rDNA transcriptional regulator pol5 isoform X1 n=2 Tax=Lycium ferocissimum TaxID=112874 RepID=UPI002815DB2E|nr:rDNA transcriptional regulator pol5 isoform X1 [Lycium ferocissimum]